MAERRMTTEEATSRLADLIEEELRGDGRKTRRAASARKRETEDALAKYRRGRAAGERIFGDRVNPEGQR